jgi:hypothetical protein
MADIRQRGQLDRSFQKNQRFFLENGRRWNAVYAFAKALATRHPANPSCEEFPPLDRLFFVIVNA